MDVGDLDDALLTAAGVDEERVDEGGVSSVLLRDRDRDAATMMGGVDSNADEKRPESDRNRLIAS